MRGSFQNVGFTDRILQVIIFDQKGLVQNFHGHGGRLWIRVIFQVHLEHFPESALAQHLLNIERLERDPIHRVVKQVFLRRRLLLLLVRLNNSWRI